MKKATALLAIIFVLVFGATVQKASAQADTTKQNGWYIEGGGQNIIGATFNYERYFSKKPGGLSFHVGFGGGVLPDFFNGGDIVLFGTAPVGLSYNIPVSQNKQHFIEVGTGYSYLFLTGNGINIISLITSYRYMPPNGRIQIRATLIPILFVTGSGESGAIPWIGFSIGKRF